jgi:hypothetical protein
MKLEQQVTSLELSKVLKVRGLKQGSLFYWHNDASLDTDWTLITSEDPRVVGPIKISAFTVAELGEMVAS